MKNTQLAAQHFSNSEQVYNPYVQISDGEFGENVRLPSLDNQPLRNQA